MLRKPITGVIILLFLLATLFPMAYSDSPTLDKTIYVDDDNTDGPWDGTQEHPYQHIQDAIDAASDGDTIFVYGGIYHEYININKSIMVVGENKENTVINALWEENTVIISASNVSFSGFKVLNCSNDGYSAGINVYGEHVHISDCILQENACGLRITFTNNVSIDNCTIRYSSAPSIYNIVSSNVFINHCDIYKNGEEFLDKRDSKSKVFPINDKSIYTGGFPGGIFVTNHEDYDHQYNISIQHCNIHDNKINGICICSGYNNVLIQNNYISNNTNEGISISDNSVATICNNTIIRNGNGLNMEGGIYLQDCKDSVTIEYNNIISNTNGIYLMRAYDNTIRSNNFINNKRDAFFQYVGKLTSSNDWVSNYWDDLRIPWMKIIFGRIGHFGIIPWFNFDENPAKEPYDIP